MTLRHKLLLAQLPLVLALALTAAGALLAAVRFGSAPGKILHQNLRSVDAGRGMLRAVEGIDRRVLTASLEGRPFRPAQVPGLVASFRQQLALQEHNITEPGERAATARLRQDWEAYRAGLDAVGDPRGLAAHRAQSEALLAAVNRIVGVNRDAMRHKSERARVEAARIGAALAATAVAAFLLAVLVSGAWLRRILAPIRVLERAVDRLATGDFEARIQVQGTDEIASLSRSFNEMATHLEQYRKSSLGELLEANNRLESVMDSLADAVIVYDLDGVPVARNEAAITLLGGGDLGLAALPEGLQEAVYDAFERVRASGEACDHPGLEAAVQLHTGAAPRWILVSATPVRSGAAVLSGVTVALRDVTRSRRMESFKGDLVASAAHELRTPLTSLHMAIHLCLERVPGELTDSQEDLLAGARQDCERLQSVVDELLEMARLGAGTARLSRAPVNVAELVRNAHLRHLARARALGVSLELVTGDGLLTVEADVARLQRVLDNLLENAVLHAGAAGQVSLGFESAGDAVRIHVDDSGPGIPPDLRDQVFTRFYRVPGTTRQGSGLGLAIVGDIVRAHGGEVGVGDSPLGGARFWASIPVRAREPTPAGGAQDEPSGSPPRAS